jgi:tRNA(Ile)-lysidine synthase
VRGARPERALDALVRGVLRFERGVPICVACSGGPDSIALASLVDRLARSADADVVLAHVNHGVRAGAAQDECVVLSVGARLGRRVLVARPHLQRDDEAALREARYAALAALARAGGASLVATAHTAEDQTETVLLALFRGTGPAGLAGIPPRRPLGEGIELVRPVLRLTHAELATELRRSGLPYALDPSNAERRYRRNALREPLDRLRAEFPQLDRAVARCATIVRAEIEGTDRARARRTMRDRLRAQDALRDVPFERIEAALDAAERGKDASLREAVQRAPDAPTRDRADPHQRRGDRRREPPDGSGDRS